MIFISVGTQLPFDRLLGYMQSWLSERGKSIEVVAQIGKSSFRSNSINTFEFVDQSKLNEIMKSCDLIVSHAGMGSIISALNFSKPIIIVPRDSSLNEHRNDHQLHTARSFEGRDGVYVAYKEQELFDLLDNSSVLKSGALVNSLEYTNLINTLKSII